MYNNVGHKTVRGTGTNGYIQRNLAYLPRERERKPYHLQEKPEAPKQRKPNKKLLERENKRAVESKVYDLRCELEDQGGISNAEITSRCNKLRKELQEKIKSGESLDDNVKSSSHKLAEAQRKKNELMAKALQIDTNKFVTGEAFNQELQAERRQKAKEEWEKGKTEEELLESKLMHPLLRKKKAEDEREERNQRREERRTREGGYDDPRYGRDRRMNRRRNDDRRKERYERSERSRRDRERNEKRRRDYSPSPPRKRRRQVSPEEEEDPQEVTPASPSNSAEVQRVKVEKKPKQKKKKKKKKSKKKKKKKKKKKRSRSSSEEASGSFENLLGEHRKNQERTQSKSKGSQDESDDDSTSS